MSENPVNLGVRFVLELAALAAFIHWGWTQHDGALRVALAFGLPLLAATIWGVFRVPGDPHPEPPVTVSGPVRLLIEAAFFGAAVLLLLAADATTAALVLGVAVLVHYAVSYDRVLRFLRGAVGEG